LGTRVIALQEEGSRTPARGVLARFAEVHGVRSFEEARDLAARFDVVLLDIRIQSFQAEDLIRQLRLSEKPSREVMVITFDSRQPPRALLRQFSQLRLFAEPPAPRLTFAQVARLFGLSQEMLARILRVSSRTVHRWLRGARPRGKPELDQLTKLASALLRSLGNAEAVRQYLTHPNPSFANERPVDLLARGEFERIAADLQAMEEGVYV
jgi:transcriptional regulator with XRE-family HTH domain